MKPNSLLRFKVDISRLYGTKYTPERFIMVGFKATWLDLEQQFDFG